MQLIVLVVLEFVSSSCSFPFTLLGWSPQVVATVFVSIAMAQSTQLSLPVPQRPGAKTCGIEIRMSMWLLDCTHRRFSTPPPTLVFDGSIHLSCLLTVCFCSSIDMRLWLFGTDATAGALHEGGCNTPEFVLVCGCFTCNYGCRAPNLVGTFYGCTLTHADF